MAVPSEPRKRPKAPATELPSKGNNTMSKYMKSNMGTTKNQTITERPVIKRKWKFLKYERRSISITMILKREGSSQSIRQTGLIFAGYYFYM